MLFEDGKLIRLQVWKEGEQTQIIFHTLLRCSLLTGDNTYLFMDMKATSRVEEDFPVSHANGNVFVAMCMYDDRHLCILDRTLCIDRRIFFFSPSRSVVLLWYINIRSNNSSSSCSFLSFFFLGTFHRQLSYEQSQSATEGLRLLRCT